MKCEIWGKTSYILRPSSHREGKRYAHPSDEHANFGRSNREQVANSNHFGDRGKGFCKVNTFSLGIAENYQTSFVTFDRSVYFIFDTINLFTTESPFPRRQYGKSPRLIVLQSDNFMSHTLSSSRIGDSFRVSSRLNFCSNRCKKMSLRRRKFVVMNKVLLDRETCLRDPNKWREQWKNGLF